MKDNTATAEASVFTLTNPTSSDVREVLGITPDRANEIITVLQDGAKTDGYGENIKGAMWGAAVNLPTEGERLLAAFLIGHGIGDNDQPHFDSPDTQDDDNPLAALLAGMGGLTDDGNDNDDDDGVI